jgi:hypothetical protein
MDVGAEGRASQAAVLGSVIKGPHHLPVPLPLSCNLCVVTAVVVMKP